MHENDVIFVHFSLFFGRQPNSPAGLLKVPFFVFLLNFRVGDHPPAYSGRGPVPLRACRNARPKITKKRLFRQGNPRNFSAFAEKLRDFLCLPHVFFVIFSSRGRLVVHGCGQYPGVGSTRVCVCTVVGTLTVVHARTPVHPWVHHGRATVPAHRLHPVCPLSGRQKVAPGP